MKFSEAVLELKFSAYVDVLQLWLVFCKSWNTLQLLPRFTVLPSQFYEVILKHIVQFFCVTIYKVDKCMMSGVLKSVQI